MKQDLAQQTPVSCVGGEAVVSSRAKGRSRVLHSESKPQMVINDVERSNELDKLYRHHRDTVLRYILRTFGAGPPDPSDVVQAAFEKFVGMDNRADIANPRAFLIASARNYVFDQRRRFKVRVDYAEDVRSTGGETDDFDPERVLVAKEQWRLLERAIHEMDDRRREVLIMNRLHGLSSAEIARRMGCSATLVKMLLAQALLLCQRALKEECE